MGCRNVRQTHLVEYHVTVVLHIGFRLCFVHLQSARIVSLGIGFQLVLMDMDALHVGSSAFLAVCVALHVDFVCVAFICKAHTL